MNTDNELANLIEEIVDTSKEILADDACDHQYAETLSGVKCIKCGHFAGNWE